MPVKSRFRAYYPPTQKELEQLWREALFALDASALLNRLYAAKRG